MKLIEVISNVDNLKPNPYSEQDKTMWLNEVEGMIFDELIRNSDEGQNSEYKPLNIQENANREMIANDRFAQLYVYYLFLKIDFMNGDTANYNNDLLLFNAEYENFSSWFIRNHKSKKLKGIFY